MNERRLLAIFAHPDDESFNCAGTLAKLTAEGVRVTLVCATRGEAGSNTSGQPVADLGAHRELELRRACEVLGLEPPVFLGYHDSGYTNPHDSAQTLRDADPLEIVRKLLEVIERAQPQVLLTFDPQGWYGHVDHLVIHRAATAAFHASANLSHPPERLFYSVLSTAMIERFNRSGFKPLEPTLYAMPINQAAVRVQIGEYREAKRAALLTHATQSAPGSGIDRLYPELHAGTSSPEFDLELYALAGSRGPISHWPLTDFFDGLG